MELKERGTGQDDTRTLSPPLEDYRSVGDFFSKAKGGRAVNETEVEPVQGDDGGAILCTCVCVCCRLPPLIRRVTF